MQEENAAVGGPAPGSRRYRLGDWLFDPDRHELCRDGERRRLQPRLVALLLCLIRADGRTVTREQLLDTAWSRRAVSDEVLSRSIADLRRALDDDAREPRMIETVPKRGYRLLLPVEPVADEGDRAETQGAGASVQPRRFTGLALAAMALSLIIVAVVFLSSRPGGGPEHAALLQPGDLVGALPLVSEAGWSQTPRFSGSGDWIAYSAADPAAGQAMIRVRARDGRSRYEIGHDGGWNLCPLFAPDGIDLYWLRHDDAGCRIRRQALPGGPVQDVSECAPAVRSCPTWTPDGHALVYTAAPAAGNHGAGLVRYELRSGRRTQISAPDSPLLSDAHPRYSPDGRTLAFLRGHSSHRRIVLAAVADGGDRELPSPVALTYGLAWLDERHLLLATDSEGFRALVRVNVDTGARTVLGARGARYPDRAPDGALVWESAHYQTHLWRLGIDTGAEAQALTGHRRSDGHPEWSPDGRYIAFQSNREGTESIWLLQLDDEHEQRLPLPSDSVWAYASWAPDGSALLISRIDGSDSSIWRYALGAAAPEPVPWLPPDGFDARYDPDGERIWYLRRTSQPDRTELWRSAPGKAPERIETGVQAYRPAAGGVFVQRSGSLRMQRCDAGSECVDLGVDIAVALPGHWTVANNALWFAPGPQPDAPGIWRLPLSGPDRSAAAAEVTGWPAPEAQQHGLAVAPDGRDAVIARTELVSLELHWLPPPSAGR